MHPAFLVLLYFLPRHPSPYLISRALSPKPNSNPVATSANPNHEIALFRNACPISRPSDPCPIGYYCQDTLRLQSLELCLHQPSASRKPFLGYTGRHRSQCKHRQVSSWVFHIKDRSNYWATDERRSSLLFKASASGTRISRVQLQPGNCKCEVIDGVGCGTPCRSGKAWCCGIIVS
jgi:hypothetical protein